MLILNSKYSFTSVIPKQFISWKPHFGSRLSFFESIDPYNRIKLFDYMSFLHGFERLRPIASTPLTYPLLPATFLVVELEFQPREGKIKWHLDTHYYDPVSS